MAIIVDHVLKEQFLAFCRENLKTRGKDSCVLSGDMLGDKFKNAMADATAGPLLRNYCSQNGLIVGYTRANGAVTITKNPNFKNVVFNAIEEEPEFMTFGDGMKYFLPYCFNDILKIISAKQSHSVYIYGPTACGKSLLVKALAKELGRKVFLVSCNCELRNEDLMGGYGPCIDKTTGQNIVKFIPGIIEQAMREGLDENGNEVGEPAILYFDEFPAMPVVSIALNHFMESNQGGKRELILKEDGGRKVVSHSGLRIIATGNTNGRGNSSVKSMAYTAQANPIDFSLLRRFEFCFNMGYDKNMEKRVIESLVDEPDVCAKILQFRDGIRKALRENELTTPFGTSHLVSICQGYGLFGTIEQAIVNTFFCFLLEEERARYGNIANLCFGVHLEAYLAKNSANVDG